jgi:hypothetical protein
MIIILIIIIFICSLCINNFNNNCENYENTSLYSHLLNDNDNNNDNNNDNDNDKLYLFQTYIDKTKIPQSVYDNIKQYASEYQHVIYDDNDCEIFLSTYFKPIVLETFKYLKLGAHKADLVRYCLLYIYGGCYIDIKTELIKPLSDIFTNKQYIYTVISTFKDRIYNGIIYSPPKNELFLKLINFIINNKDPSYHLYCKDFYNNILQECGIVIAGKNNGKYNTYYLFHEECSTNSELCYDGLDRYGLCCNAYDNDNKIIKIRRSSYPFTPLVI